MKLLHIIASPRESQSRTLQVSDAFLNVLQNRCPDLEVEKLELFRMKLPEITVSAIDTKFANIAAGPSKRTFTPQEQEVFRYAMDFLNADMYLITAPMWNFSLPYKLKHYIDLIVQPNLLFRFTEQGVEGLVRDKKMICITSRGSDYGANSPITAFDFQESYLRAIFGMTGITDMSFIHAQPMDVPGIGQEALNRAMKESAGLASRLELPLSAPM